MSNLSGRLLNENKTVTLFAAWKVGNHHLAIWIEKLYGYNKIVMDIVDWRARPRLQPDRARILGASRVWDQDWGLPRVKCGTGGCNPTLCQPEAGLVTSWSERSERSDENPVRWLALQSTSDPLRLQLYNTRILISSGGRPRPCAGGGDDKSVVFCTQV